ncbi:hypothetical protein BGZ95_004531 [Linnemannia exigua]|uniref:DDE Tnp4 domain-containing protein n=1 Tax=Linnemannia exigua TaxID=604196 RepID=A0AAD4DHP1_9FUNG|nr:hypothetical protein BGZ95_004531 [Linnemannia exigua]
MHKFALMRSYGVQDHSIVTSEWVGVFDKADEKEWSKNLTALSRKGGVSLKSCLALVKQCEDIGLDNSLRALTTAEAHSGIDSTQFVKLDYAVGILSACGFEDTFATNKVLAEDLKSRIDEIWGWAGLERNMSQICTTLKKRRPRSSNWTFKTKLAFINTVLHAVLGARISGTNSHKSRYRLNHTSSVGTAALEYDAIVQNYWKFLHYDWPIIDRLKHHRTEISAVNDIDSIKKIVLNRLGTIPVFFFLTMIFGTRAYSCPYRNIEKGVMILYVLVKGVSMSDMAQYIPKTLFHTIHKEFYMYNPVAPNLPLTTMLSEMFSILKSRHLAAERNPKLKKSGFRVQVGTDMNNMVLFVSAPAPCKDYNDGTMLLRMGIRNNLYKLDCVALDDGYNLFISKLLDSADELQYENFCYPIRKMRGIALTEEEKAYNEIFGSFRSRIESYFGEMQSTFTKFSHTVVNKVAEKETFSVQYKLACLLMNIKRSVALRNIPTEQHHML